MKADEMVRQIAEKRAYAPYDLSIIGRDEFESALREMARAVIEECARYIKQEGGMPRLAADMRRALASRYEDTK